MSTTYEYECVNRIKSLKQGIESATGKTYSDLTSAIQGLKDSGGNIEDFVKQHAFDGNDVVVPNTVTDLRYGAFAGCYVGNVTLPEGLDDIAVYAFYFTVFRNDATVILPNSLRTIGYCAFYGADMNNITIPEGVTEIGKEAFYGCTKLQNITIPASVTTIGESAFSRCSQLSTVTFNGTPTTLPYLFTGSSKLTTINVPWSEGEVAGAPWGATNATINYNYTGG